MKEVYKIMYFKITYLNGFCGCDEEEYIIAECEEDAWQYLMDTIENYSFYNDDRYLDETYFEENDGSEDAWDTAWNVYHENIMDYSGIEEITEEEYNENVG